MKTVKEVADLTGISVRMLHYYDKIGLFKPSEVNEAGYRFYDEESLETLQQILFFKELDILASQVDKNPTSKEVQEIVDEIAKTTKNNNEFLKGDTGINYKAFLGNMADIYFKAASEENNLIDKKYIKGTAKFIGEALKYYSEN